MTKKYKLPFSGRAHTYTKEECEMVIDVMQNADTLTQGIYLKKFEDDFQSFIGDGHYFAVSSAASALELIAQICAFNNDDEIIVPVHTYTASVLPFIKHGAKIIWADIDPSTRVINAEIFEKLITKKTKAILVVHLYGFCADMDKIVTIARKKGILVIEDVAQALGTDLKGKRAGVFGDFSAFSFHSHKNLSTLGEGGILRVKDKNFADMIPMLRHNGHCDFGYLREQYWLPAMSNIDIPEIEGRKLLPNNFSIGEVQCALGSKLLERIDEINLEKRNRAIFLIDELSSFDFILFHREASSRHNYHLLALEFLMPYRDIFFEEMIEYGIQCAVQYYPLNRYDLYKKLGYGYADCPNSEKFFDNMASLPFQHMMSDEEFIYLIDSLKKVLKKIDARKT